MRPSSNHEFVAVCLRGRFSLLTQCMITPDRCVTREVKASQTPSGSAMCKMVSRVTTSMQLSPLLPKMEQSHLQPRQKSEISVFGNLLLSRDPRLSLLYRRTKIDCPADNKIILRMIRSTCFTPSGKRGLRHSSPFGVMWRSGVVV